MQEYKNQNSNIEIRYMPYIKENEWQNTLNKFLLNELHNLDNSPQYIITTRIDNDDAFNLSYIDEIQNYFLSHQQEAVINFANGLQYVSKCNVLKNHRNKYGHFGTLIEKNDGKAKTVFFFPHNEPPVGLKSICLNNKHPMWIEVLHQTNIMNRTDFQIRSLFKDLFFIGFKYRNLSDFGIKQEILRFNLYTWKVFFEWFCKKIRALLKKF
jgi:hypothetical protein